MWHRWAARSAWCSCGLLKRSDASVFSRGEPSNDPEAEMRRATFLAMRVLVDGLLENADEGPPEPVGGGSCGET